MLSKIQRFFEQALQEPEQVLTYDDKQLAACALMVEVAAIDEHFSDVELTALGQEMQRQFQLPAESADELIELATAEQDKAASLHQFTKLVNDHCDTNEKFELMVGMWRIAFADDHLDKYEEYMVRKVSELIYVSHSDFIRSKQVAKRG